MRNKWFGQVVDVDRIEFKKDYFLKNCEKNGHLTEFSKLPLFARVLPPIRQLSLFLHPDCVLDSQSNSISLKSVSHLMLI